MSLYEQDEPLAGATAEKPAGEADLVVPDYAPAPAPIDPNATAEKSCLDVIATVYPDADAVNKVAAAESAALQTRMCVWTQGAGRLLRRRFCTLLRLASPSATDGRARESSCRCRLPGFAILQVQPDVLGGGGYGHALPLWHLHRASEQRLFYGGGFV